jgi:hypothetical protein
MAFSYRLNERIDRNGAIAPEEPRLPCPTLEFARITPAPTLRVVREGWKKLSWTNLGP